MIGMILIIGRQSNVNGRLAFIKFRLKSAERRRCRRHGQATQGRRRSLALIWCGRRGWLNRIHLVQRAKHGRPVASDQRWRRRRCRRRNGRIARRRSDGRQRIEKRREGRRRAYHRTWIRRQIQIVTAGMAMSTRWCRCRSSAKQRRRIGSQTVTARWRWRPLALIVQTLRTALFDTE